MSPKLKQYLNRTIPVSIPALFEDSIPALFEDGKCRAFTLRGADSDGVWLASSALVDRLLLERETSIVASEPPVFLPYAQIAGIILAAPTPDAPPPKSDRTT
jgi:hypothetical protein